MIIKPDHLQEKKEIRPTPTAQAKNLFIITIDGFRWQEIFNGADSALINNEKYTGDTATMKLLYWASSAEERRKRLMPFLWNVVAAKGQIFGNRNFNNKVNVANAYAISYPGYNEIFTGTTDPSISSNAKDQNPNLNILELLNSQEEFKGKVAAFTSWNVFPYILNKERNGLMINSGYENLVDSTTTSTQKLINTIQTDVMENKEATRHDELTFLTAKEFLQHHETRVLFLGFGETDEFAHKEQYDLYLQQASKLDRMIADLWHWVQSTPGYKDNTAFIITTDHGRGSKKNKWSQHDSFIKGSSETWMAVIGSGIKPTGEVKEEEQIYEMQIAQTIAVLLGEKFTSDQPLASAISFK